MSDTEAYLIAMLVLTITAFLMILLLLYMQMNWWPFHEPTTPPEVYPTHYFLPPRKVLNSTIVISQFTLR